MCMPRCHDGRFVPPPSESRTAPLQLVPHLLFSPFWSGWMVRQSGGLGLACWLTPSHGARALSWCGGCTYVCCKLPASDQDGAVEVQNSMQARPLLSLHVSNDHPHPRRTSAAIIGRLDASVARRCCHRMADLAVPVASVHSGRSLAHQPEHAHRENG